MVTAAWACHFLRPGKMQVGQGRLRRDIETLGEISGRAALRSDLGCIWQGDGREGRQVWGAAGWRKRWAHLAGSRSRASGRSWARCCGSRVSLRRSCGCRLGCPVVLRRRRCSSALRGIARRRWLSGPSRRVVGRRSRRIAFSRILAPTGASGQQCPQQRAQATAQLRAYVQSHAPCQDLPPSPAPPMLPRRPRLRFIHCGPAPRVRRPQF
jgi:hypothetical protein